MNPTARMPSSHPPAGDAGPPESTTAVEHPPAPPTAAPFGVGAALALLAGVSTCLWLPSLASGGALVLALVAGLLLWWRGRHMRWFGAALLGFGLAGLHAAHALSVQLPRSEMMAALFASRSVRGFMTHGSTNTTGSSTVTS